MSLQCPSGDLKLSKQNQKIKNTYFLDYDMQIIPEITELGQLYLYLGLILEGKNELGLPHCI